MAEKVVAFRLTLTGEQETVNSLTKVRNVLSDSVAQLKEMKRNGEDVGNVTYDKLINSVAAAKLEAKELTNEIKAQQREFELAKTAAGSYRELDLRLQKLRETYRQLGDEERKASGGQSILKDISQLDKQLKAIDASMGQYQRNVGNYADAFGKVIPIVQGLAGSLGVLGSLDEIIQGNAKVSDSLADVQRVSQLSKQQVEGLFEALKTIDTRTSLENLIGISVIGGKLGVAEKELIGFTKAADALQVALGDELGGNVEETTTKLGKLANIFSADNDKAITGDKLLNIGNAIVVLANKGVASGGFLTDFSERLAGLAGISRITLPDTLGLGAGFEELGQHAEKSSTAVQGVILKMGQEVPKYAKLAGVGVDEFGKLVNEKPVEALIKLAEGLQKNKNGLTEISKSFKDAEESGAGIVATLGVLGKNGDFFREKIQDGTTAIQSQNDILDAYKLKNETAGAAVDKLKKSIVDITTSTQFQRFLYDSISAISGFIGAIANLPTFLSENKAAFVAVGVAMLSLNFKAVRDGLVLLGNGFVVLAEKEAIANAESKIFTKALNNLIIIGVAIAFYGISRAIDAYNDKIRDAYLGTILFEEGQKKAIESTAEETNKINTLFEVLKRSNTTQEQRHAIVQKLNKDYPELLKNTDLEKASISELTAVQQKLTNAIIAQAVIKQKIKSQEEIANKIIQKEQFVATSEKQQSAISDNIIGFDGSTGGSIRGQFQSDIEGTKAEIDILKGQLAESNQLYDNLARSYGLTSEQIVNQTVKTVADGISATGELSKEETKRREKAAKEIQKETTERIKYEEHAAERIAQLRKQLNEKTYESQKQGIINDFAEQERKAVFEKDQAILKLNGTAENVAKEKAMYQGLYQTETDLIKENLRVKLDSLNEQKTANENAAKRELEAARQDLKASRNQNTLTNIQETGAANVRVNQIDEIVINTDFTAKEKAIRDEYSKKKNVTEGGEKQLSERLAKLAIERDAALLVIRKRGFALLSEQVKLEYAAQLAVYQNQRTKELSDITQRETEKRAKLDEALKQGLISIEQYQQGLKDIEAKANDERKQADTAFLNNKAKLISTLSINVLGEAKAIADQEVKINADKNQRILDDDRQAITKRQAILQAQLELLGTFATGAKDIFIQISADEISKNAEKNKKLLENTNLTADQKTAIQKKQSDDEIAIKRKYGAIIKALALAEIAINLSRELSAISVAAAANPTNAVTFGIAGLTQYGVQSGIAIAKAGFAAYKVIGQKFEFGGIEPTANRSDNIAAVHGGSIPSESGVIQGRSHSQGGVKVMSKFGNFYEVEGGEYRLRNGRETYIINKKSTNAFRSELDTLSKLVRPSVFDPKRKMLAAQINSMPKFASGGVITEGGRNPLFDTFLLPAPSAAKSSQIVVNNVQQTDETLIAAIQRLENIAIATNNRIDRIAVINNPTDALNAATENATIKNVQSL